jgi:CubicO group peptidase (beta-lactamase class C family)
MKRTFAAIAFLALLLPLGQARSQELAGTIVLGELGKKLDSVVASVGKGKFWGSVLVARDGKVLLAKGYGCADMKAVPNSPLHLFDIGSVSKQFTAAASPRGRDVPTRWCGAIRAARPTG